MASPAIVLVFTFLIAPFLMAFGLSFTNQRLISPNPTEFVGMRNFSQMFRFATLEMEPERDPVTGNALTDEDGAYVYPKLRAYTRGNSEYEHLRGMRELTSWQRDETRVVLLAGDVLFIRALLNTARFVLIVVPTQGGLALLLALLLNRKIRGINIFRTIYFMPVVVSMVVVSLLWRFIYDGENGLLNSTLAWITWGAFRAVDWLGSPRTAMPAIIGMSVWQAVGFHMVIWLAGLQNIPVIRYEAASIDGAGGWSRFRYITWPGLRNTAVFIFVVITMQAFALFVQIDVMTKGGPLDSTQSIVFQVVDRGYWKQDIAGGSALSVVFFAIVLSISALQRYITREKGV